MRIMTSLSSSAFESPFGRGTFASESRSSDWIQHRLVGLTKLMEITRLLALETELDPILHLVTEGACQALECDRASLFLYDERSHELYTRVATELEIHEIRMPLGAGVNGWVGQNKQLVNVSDPHNDSRWNAVFDRQTGYQTRSILAAPLVSPRDERLLGTLQLLNKKNDEPFDRADENLLEAFAAHAAVSLERIDLLERHRKSLELEGSLEAARKVQARFLPQSLPHFDGYELAAWWHPALGVGGDYYDALLLPDGRLALVVADVSGHGLAPSLIMASARAMLHVLSRTISEPARILTLLNETITPDLQIGQFITFLLGALDPQQHCIHFCNAGHAPSFHLQRSTGEIRHFAATCCPIGVVCGECPPAPAAIRMDPGDLAIFATDGAIELRNAEGQMFGRERFEELLRKNQTAPANELMEVLKQALADFYPGSHPEDDITILVLERKLD